MIIKSKYEGCGSISLTETGYDYDFIAYIENDTDKTQKIFVNDLEGWYSEPIKIAPHDRVGLFADEEGRERLAFLFDGDFKAIYEDKRCANNG